MEAPLTSFPRDRDVVEWRRIRRAKKSACTARPVYKPPGLIYTELHPSSTCIAYSCPFIPCILSHPMMSDSPLPPNGNRAPNGTLVDAVPEVSRIMLHLYPVTRISQPWPRVACDQCRRTKSKCERDKGGPARRPCRGCVALGLRTSTHNLTFRVICLHLAFCQRVPTPVSLGVCSVSVL